LTVPIIFSLYLYWTGEKLFHVGENGGQRRDTGRGKKMKIGLKIEMIDWCAAEGFVTKLIW